jgi:hypothetical protein
MLPLAITGPAIAAQSVTATTLPSRCVNSTPAAPVTDQARISAQEIAGRAQTASINGDNVVATDLYRRAATLDPTDPGIAYALGRDYETVRDPRAMAEYCRFLALSPRSLEAPDVRQRIAALAFALPPDTTVVRIPVAAPTGMPSPGAALVSGLIIPGLGQFITHTPTVGLLVMAATAGSAFYGLQTRNVTSQVTHTAIDPLGHTYQYQTTETRSERPNMAVGLGAAAAISIVAAVSAFARARGYRTTATASVPASDGDSRGTGSLTPLFTVTPRSIGLGLSLR